MYRIISNIISVAVATTVSFVGMYDKAVIAPPEPIVVVANTTATTLATIPEVTTTTTTTTIVEESPKVTLREVPDDESERCPRFEPLFKEYGLEPVDTFSYIAYRESRCRIKAVNAKWDENGKIVWTLNKDGSYDIGLLQINSTWKTVTRNICGGDITMLYKLDCNLRVAKYLLDNGGLGHWSSMK